MPRFYVVVNSFPTGLTTIAFVLLSEKQLEFHKHEWVFATAEDFTKMPECPTPDLKEMLKGQKDAGFVEVK